ncbi:hypothetical protein ABW636_08780 [Aquimarina sp. 2201CG1-2-11]|uniref:hypothetical protein n=1 Tax=Aquimarina discodermiae TaxID=3231043 RepID=UPI003462D72A
MNSTLKHIELIDRIDQLIRLQATGTPLQLAHKLGISKAKLYRTLHTMRALKAPLEYDNGIQSFVYYETVGFTVGFFSKERINRKSRLV